MTKRRKKFSERETEARRQKFKEIYKDLTDAQIADIHEVSIRTVQRWKKGDYDPGVHLKFALSDRMSSYGHFVGDHERAVRRLRHILKTADPVIAGAVIGILKLVDDFVAVSEKIGQLEAAFERAEQGRRSGKDRRHKNLTVVKNRRNGTDRRT
jgi:DNA-binding XRE family transcriptional regulator